MKGVIRAVTVLWLACAGAAHAQPVLDQVVSQLQQQGYTAITVTRTFLGRTRIQATSPTQSREIVMNAASGEILRDVWQQRSGSTSPGGGAGGDIGNKPGGGKAPSGTAPSGGTQVDRDHDDDHDDDSGRGRGRGRGGDDDDRSNNSGRGSDNSGSGSDGDDD